MPPTAWVTVQTVVTQVIAIGLFAIQAPLLGPTAFGLFSFVMVFVGFCELVLNGGVTEALISIRSIEDRHYSVVTTISAAFSLLLGLIVFAAAHPLAQLCGQPDSYQLFRYMAVLPLITSFAAAPSAAAKRDMHFRALAVRAIVGWVAGGTVGVILAFRGDGAWALVFQALIQRVVSVIALWLSVPIRLRFAWSARHLQDVWKYTAPIVLASVMGWAQGQIPRLILGIWLGPTDLGLFSMATRLCEILVQTAVVPSTVVARVSLRKFAVDPEGRDEAIHRVLYHMCAWCFPLSIGGAALLPDLFRVWLDARWYPGIVASQLMLLMAVPLVTVYLGNAILMAFNEQHYDALISTLQTISTVVVVLIAAPFGLLIAVLAILVRPFLLLPLQISILTRRCAIRPRVLFAPQLPSLAAACLAGAVVYFSRPVLEAHLGSAITLVLLGTAGLILYFAALAACSPQGTAALAGRLRLFGRSAP